MINNNKILTVSYGTFSCTLEGFDDSFGTMKAIAEYFRDLASEDRYFGAEPPQPDAEMLAHIAQKEISRRVQARQQDGKIVLSARQDGDEAAATPRGSLSAPTDRSAVSTSFAPRRPNEISTYYDAYRLNALKVAISVQPAVPAAPAHEKSAAAEVTKEAEAQTVGADAPKVEAPEATTTHVPTPHTEVPVDAPAAVESSEKPEIIPPPFVTKAPTEQPDMSDLDIVPGQPDEEIEAFFAESLKTDQAGDELEEDAEITEIAAPVPALAVRESIAAKLQRIRAVVSSQGSKAVLPDYTEDEHAEETTADAAEPDTQAIVADAVHDIEEALEQDDVIATADAASHIVEDGEEDEEDITALLSRLETQDDAQEQPEHSGATADQSLDNDADADAETDLLGQEDQADTAPRGRVIKVKRADLELAIAKGALEEYATDGDEDQPNEALQDPQPSDASEDDLSANVASSDRSDAESTLSAEEEEELARELAEVEATLAGNEEEDDDSPMRTASARRHLPSLDADQGSDMNRLLAETDNQMDDPEGATRRNAITHLRAAVAAKKADFALGAAQTPDEDDDAYRNDLAEVVKPRRPVSGTVRTERPSDARPAPLKLVAEQRIDINVPRSGTPVRPRRVAAVAVAEAVSPTASGFAEFAAEMGARKLPELLEAAAAYMSFVEGLDQFSRPQLMNTVRQADKEDFSREEGLRSFGQLLRAGKLEKLDGGRFKASDDIGYHPDARAAG